MKIICRMLCSIVIVAVVFPAMAFGMQVVENSGGIGLSDQRIAADGMAVQVLMSNGPATVADLLGKTYIPESELITSVGRAGSSDRVVDSGLPLHRLLEMPAVTVDEMINLARDQGFPGDAKPVASPVIVATPKDAGTGAEDKSARVYGCLGLPYSCL